MQYLKIVKLPTAITMKQDAGSVQKKVTHKTSADMLKRFSAILAFVMVTSRNFVLMKTEMKHILTRTMALKRIWPTPHI